MLLLVFIHVIQAKIDCSGDFQVLSQSDAKRLSYCTKYKGSIYVNKVESEELDFGNLAELYGELYIVDNFNLKSLILNGLAIVNGSITIRENTQLMALSVPKLHTLIDLSLSDNPNLSYLNIQSITYMNSVRIAQVGIAEFGIPKIVQLDYLDIENNDGLRKIEIPRLKKVNSYVKISNNNALSTATFNSLNEIDGNVTFSGLSAISAPKLGGIADSLVFLENTFESLALEKLQVVGKELQLIRNDNMKAFSFPSLKKIGGATIIQNNTEMTAIDENCFPLLQQLIGKMLLIGPLEYIAIPALKSTSIPVTITSSGNLDCFETKKRHEIKGRDKWVCSSLKSKKDKGEPKEVDFNKLVDSSSNPLKLFGNIGFFIAILFFTILTILL